MPIQLTNSSLPNFINHADSFYSKYIVTSRRLKSLCARCPIDSNGSDVSSRLIGLVGSACARAVLKPRNCRTHCLYGAAPTRRRCGRVVKALDSGLKGTGFEPHRDHLCFFLGQENLPLLLHSTQVKMGTWPFW